MTFAQKEIFDSLKKEMNECIVFKNPFLSAADNLAIGTEEKDAKTPTIASTFKAEWTKRAQQMATRDKTQTIAPMDEAVVTMVS